MLNKNSGQIDVFDNMIFEKLIPKDHLLVQIESIVNFSFVYSKLTDKYSPLGRSSKDPVMMLKILILEYLYNLSDVEVVNRIKTDVAFRWFLKLSINDPVPDDTTISYFRIKRLGEKCFDEFFNEIVKQCIERNLIKTKRYIIDTTDVAANVNYPSEKKLVRNAYRKVIKELEQFDGTLAKQQLEKYEEDIQEEYNLHENVNSKKHFEITREHLGYLYLKTYDKLQIDSKYTEAFGVCHSIVEQYLNIEKDKIVSVVDPDARVAHKSPGNIKRGYKDHIIVDEDSEIILASIQTPFNTGDEKKFKELINKVENNLEIKPEEISADKVYGTIENRAYLKDNEILSNIAFYKESDRGTTYFGIKEFVISEDMSFITCPNGIVSTKFAIINEKERVFKKIKFDRKYCDKCKLRNQCLYKSKNGNLCRKSKDVKIPVRYDALLNDLKRVETEEFEKAYDKRYKIERRFATMVRNHGLRRCRYLKLEGAKIHITMANMVCNIVRMVKLLLYQPVINIH